MNWFQRISQQPLVLWHATTANLAEEITNDGKLIPSLDLEQEKGQNYSGWNFQEPGQQYGEGVYLAKSAEDAIYYASIRLRDEWNDQVDLYDDNTGYLGLFKVYIADQTRLIVDRSSPGEFMYKGRVSNRPNSEAWFEGPKWVSRSRDLEKYRSKLEIPDELPEGFDPNDSDRN